VKTRRRCGCRRLLCAAAVCLLLAGGLCAVLFAVVLPALSDTPDAGNSTAAGENEWFRVVSGPCTTSENGRCVGRPDGYAAFEVCEIAVGRVGGRALLLSSN
jgi:hypothetical protein